MADIPPEPTILGLKVAHLLAGGMGGLVRSLTHPGGSIMRHITTSIVGTAVAGYGTPVAAQVAASYVPMPAVPLASLEGMVGFVLGLIGMSLCEMLIRWARDLRDRPPPSLPRP